MRCEVDALASPALRGEQRGRSLLELGWFWPCQLAEPCYEMVQLEQCLTTGIRSAAFYVFRCDLMLSIYTQMPVSQYFANYSLRFIAASRRSFLTVNLGIVHYFWRYTRPFEVTWNLGAEKSQLPDRKITERWLSFSNSRFPQFQVQLLTFWHRWLQPVTDCYFWLPSMWT